MNSHNGIAPFAVVKVNSSMDNQSPNRWPTLFEIMQAIISLIVLIGGGYLLTIPEFNEKAVITATMGAVIGFYFSVAYMRNEKDKPK